MSDKYFVVRYSLVRDDVAETIYEDRMNLWHPAVGSYHTICRHHEEGIQCKVFDVHSRHEPWEIVNELRLVVTVYLVPLVSANPTSES